MTQLEQSFFTLGCRFFGTQNGNNKKSDFVEVHVGGYRTGHAITPKTINKRHIISFEDNGMGNIWDVKSVIRTTKESFAVTETYEQLKQMIL